MGTFRRVISFTLAAGLAVTPIAAAEAGTGSAAGTALIRVNQLGYTGAPGQSAYLMTSQAAPGTRFEVVDSRGRRVLSGRAGQDTGTWNDTYKHVYKLDLSALWRPGTYRVKVAGAPTSPAFEVGSDRRLLNGAKDKAVNFFTEQRDGADVVPGSLNRKPAHLTDRAASVYDWPVFAGPDTDQSVGELRKIGGPVDVEGGWYDAGDYLKFTHIAAYSDSLLWASARDGRWPDPTLVKEARHGLAWLDKMWDERTKTLYIQVGAGTGNVEGTFIGDHDIWRLPEADDLDNAPGHHLIKNRPVFRAAAPGQPISPNLAGRTAAAFALAAQVEARTSPARARRHLETAAAIFAQARTTDVKQLVTSLPFAFYPESNWRDDLELGAAELALAAQKLRDPRARGWLKTAEYWSGEYRKHEAGGDTLNLYDVSALAHADLIRAARADRRVPVNVKALEDDLRAQLEIGTKRAATDPFGAGAQYDNFDAVPHAFGLAATARLYRTVTGDRRYDGFGTGQLNWNFGANPWGVSFMVGVGEATERCPHHQIANIVGRPLTGGVVNGPNSADLFTDGLGDNLDNMKPCPADGVDTFEQFTGRGSRYVDDVRSWQASEPADDFAAIAVYALTR
ncbi:glycoside hydrolase family 9 protein [Kribbella sp. CA-293567]|uniref:glycoside hydrolase family 9 protein n=1 Tax=Kribbella sp. CA-293567 TaxID=3002436 RepID=UPI0022DE820B|nr:glycoside hydrolase family 9 protein [Kribbella sp. CA-293567]WBQ01844.1 glycoside hydrolase family 9 protein [Kribbella sp. CA-293567]